MITRIFESRVNTKLFSGSVLSLLGDMLKQRKVMIILSLLEESKGKTDKELQKEVMEGLSGVYFPWCKGIEEIKIIEE
ncbi:MAG: hypothetical protein ABSC20_07930 [Candidatus Bathyarchaeia archaeon]